MLAERSRDAAAGSGIIGRVLAKTSIFFMVAAAIDIVCNYAAVPAKLARLADIFFIIAAALQGAIWAREIILGVIRQPRRRGSGELDARQCDVAHPRAGQRRLVRASRSSSSSTISASTSPRWSPASASAASPSASPRRASSPTCSRRSRSCSTGRSAAATRSATAPPPARSSGSASRPPACARVTGEQVIMANTKLLEQEVHNLAEAKVRRIFLPFGADLPDARRDARAAARDRRAERGRSRSRAASWCAASSPTSAPSSIDCELVYDDRTDRPDTLAAHKSAIIIAIVRIFAERRHRLRLPDPDDLHRRARRDAGHALGVCRSVACAGLVSALRGGPRTAPMPIATLDDIRARVGSEIGVSDWIDGRPGRASTPSPTRPRTASSSTSIPPPPRRPRSAAPSPTASCRCRCSAAWRPT